MCTHSCWHSMHDGGGMLVRAEEAMGDLSLHTGPSTSMSTPHDGCPGSDWGGAACRGGGHSVGNSLTEVTFDMAAMAMRLAPAELISFPMVLYPARFSRLSAAVPRFTGLLALPIPVCGSKARSLLARF